MRAWVSGIYFSAFNFKIHTCEMLKKIIDECTRHFCYPQTDVCHFATRDMSTEAEDRSASLRCPRQSPSRLVAVALEMLGVPDARSARDQEQKSLRICAQVEWATGLIKPR